MSKLKQVLPKSLEAINAAYLVLFVVIGTEIFHFVNSIKLNMIMPTIANLLKEKTVRSWQYGNGTVCIRYGNFLWDTLSVIVFMLLSYLLWRFVVKKLVK